MKVVPLAERATLGALLLQDPLGPAIPIASCAVNSVAAPGRGAGAGADMLGWLRPQDFADPWHREVYATIRAHAAAGDTVRAEAAGLDLLRRLGPTRAQVVRVAGLLHDLPPGAQAATYAVMVLEAALRREVTAHGVLLQAAALQCALDGSARPMTAITAVVDAALEQGMQRWAAATGQTAMGQSATGRSPACPGRTSAAREPVAVRSAVARLESSYGADRLLAAHPPLTPGQIAEHEATLIAALIAHPQRIGASAAGWLRPDTVTNRAWRPVYESVLRLHTEGRRIDAVTVFWETQRASRAAGRGPDPAAGVAAVERARTADPDYWARVVSADHLRLAADRAADSLRTAAANPGLDLAQVFSTGHILTQALSTAARPLEPPAADRRGLATVHALPDRQTRRAGPVAG
ncbi:DnaB-like helicase N-terminal domain-containing protein [Sporichthya polymorpha]|uniref:DnaB-like helicase N-terminal domain-containing protein n=1 Tax=Sporichthya polymorpha TaxID=35751 RepID=UPI00036E95EE|nr:DnaB-like helicase N-terminal domain-containing protein [Sporichthya polymorpha]